MAPEIKKLVLAVRSALARSRVETVKQRLRVFLRKPVRWFWRALFASFLRTEHPAAGMPALTIDDLTEGDWVFCERPSMMALLNIVGGHSWRHVGVVVRRDGQLVIADFNWPGYSTRSLGELRGNYTRTAVMRPLKKPCCKASVSDAASKLLSAAPGYSRAALFVGAAFMFARRVNLGTHPVVLRRFLRWAASRPGLAGRLCSTNVIVASFRCCLGTPRIAMSSDEQGDAVLAAIIATPTDMWLSACGPRFFLDTTVGTVSDLVLPHEVAA